MTTHAHPAKPADPMLLITEVVTSLAQRTQMENARRSRRADKRYGVDRRIGLSSKPPAPSGRLTPDGLGFVLNLSCQGIGLLVLKPVPIGTILWIDLASLGVASAAVRLRTVRTEEILPGVHRVGAEFQFDS